MSRYLVKDCRVVELGADIKRCAGSVYGLLGGDETDNLDDRAGTMVFHDMLRREIERLHDLTSKALGRTKEDER
jgi:hypothetical protein